MGWFDSESTTQQKLPYYARNKVPEAADSTTNLFNLHDPGAEGPRLTGGDFELWGELLAPDLNEQQLQGLREALSYGFDDAGLEFAKKTLYSQIKNPQGPQYNKFTPNKHVASDFRLTDAFDPNSGAYSPEEVDWTAVSGPESIGWDAVSGPEAFDADPSAWALEAPGVTTGGAYEIGDTDTFLQNAFDAMSRQVGQAVDTKFAQAGRSGATSARTADFGTQLFDAYAPMALSEAARRQQLGFDAYEAAEGRGLTAQDMAFGQDQAAAELAFDTAFQPWQLEQQLQLEADLANQATELDANSLIAQLGLEADVANQQLEADLGQFYETMKMSDAQFDTEQERLAYEQWANRVVEHDQNRADEKFRTKEANITNSEEAFQNWVENDLNSYMAGGELSQSAIAMLDDLGAEERAKIESILGVGDALYQQEVTQNMAPLEMIEIYNDLLRQTDWGNGPVTATQSPGAFDLVNAGIRTGAGVAGAF